MISYSQARKEFIKLRNEFEEIVSKTPKRNLDEVFAEKFSEVYTDATLGNVVAQDYLGYIFKRGKDGLVPENIDLSMKWLILAGANGNPLSLQRLSIFLNFAYDEVVNQPDLENILYRNKLNQSNFSYEVGKLICEALVDELKIDALEIIKEIPTTLEFNATTMGGYDKAKNNAVPVVLTYLRGLNPHKKVEKDNLHAKETKKRPSTKQKKNNKDES